MAAHAAGGGPQGPLAARKAPGRAAAGSRGWASGPRGAAMGPPGPRTWQKTQLKDALAKGQLTANPGGRCPLGALGLLRGRPSLVEKDTGRLEGGVAPGSRVALLGEARAALSPTPPAWAPRLCTWPTCARGRASHALAAPNTRGRAKKGEVQGPTQGHMGTWDCWADGTARLSPRPHKHRLHEDDELTTHRTPAPL